MSLTEVTENNVAVNTKRASSAYVPTLQRTTGQPPPIAANGGLSYMSFDRNGSVTDGSVSRWSFHTACIDPNAPADARNRKNVVVRAFVFF